MTLTVDEVKGFLKQMDEEEEFDDMSWMLLPSLPLLVGKAYLAPVELTHENPQRLQSFSRRRLFIC